MRWKKELELRSIIKLCKRMLNSVDPSELNVSDTEIGYLGAYSVGI